ncbi:MAG: dihydrodipicolinate synthase family protein [Bryobacterales bacterium]|jgi:dihydrodipicolinate synthase/N-acetylneuraminate lyase|nr:dihydrodipicolinate synthase family protein [Bryobacterales bacterium]
MDVRERLLEGLVIPAHPLALDARRKLDVRRQVALTRYYVDAGVGGVAVGVHTTQFAIRDPQVALFEPLLELTAATLADRPVLRIAGICGETAQALREARFAADWGYHAGLLSLAALQQHTIAQLLEHARAVAEVIPVVGFYLQPAVGGRNLPYVFWRQFAEIDNVVAIKVAPFNRYQTLDVVRAVADSGRAHEVALYTGNDDNILMDLLTPFRVGEQTLRFRGGLLGHWAVWSHTAVQHLRLVKQVVSDGQPVPQELVALAADITDANAALFDAANGFQGCIAGLHEILRRQGLLEGIWCLDPREGLSPGQMEEIDRVTRAYPHLLDDAFVEANRHRWLNQSR